MKAGLSYENIDLFENICSSKFHLASSLDRWQLLLKLHTLVIELKIVFQITWKFYVQLDTKLSLIWTYLSFHVLLDDVGQVLGVREPVELVGQMDGIEEECPQDTGDFNLGVPEI